MGQDSVRVAQKALELIRRSWIKGQYATDSQGFEVDASDGDAVKFCSVGAVMSASNLICEEEHDSLGVVLEALAQVLEGTARSSYSSEDVVVSWNDAPERTKDQVVCAFTKAIKKLEISAGDL